MTDQDITTTEDEVGTRQRAIEAYESARDRAADTLGEAPLLALAGGIAAGALIAALLPRTETETRAIRPTARRVKVAPNIPTVAEVTGIKEFDFSLWAGLFAPKGTPAPVIEALNTAFNQTLNDPKINARLADTGAQVTAMTTAEFSGFVHAESEKYEKLIQETGVKVK